MAVGFGNIDNFQETIQATIDNAVDFARSQLFEKSLTNCIDCDNIIPEARRKAINAIRCVNCQSLHDKKVPSGYNRSGSKDSQLR
ncbi:MAG: hypothetical protein [Caudoviricetes sp.]|nr:MAG: hypothetical protein [Caudoviricetes sp.]